MNSTSIPKSVLIICLGNICRSPAAEYFLRHYATQSPFEKIQNIEFKSAGLLGGPGPMYRNSRKYLNNKGIPHNEFTSKTVTIEMLENSDLIFVLEKYMKIDLLKILDGKRHLVKDRIYTLKEAVGKSGDI